jgi:hypothetical protein
MIRSQMCIVPSAITRTAHKRSRVARRVEEAIRFSCNMYMRMYMHMYVTFWH